MTTIKQSSLTANDKSALIGLIDDLDMATSKNRQECLMKIKSFLGTNYDEFIRTHESIKLQLSDMRPTTGLRTGRLTIIYLGIINFIDLMKIQPLNQKDTTNG